MKSPLVTGPWLTLEETPSTQTLAELWLKGEVEGEVPGVLFALHQSEGRGRYGRTWLSERGDSLTMSLVFQAYANHPKPWLVGMAVSLAVAGAIHSQVQWPNDLVCQKKKVGGILSTLIESPQWGKVPVVGVGVNLNQRSLDPEIAAFATSLRLEHGQQYDPLKVAQDIVSRIQSIPEPDSWESLRPVWDLFDDTPGKRYMLRTGEMAVAIAVGTDGQLLCAVDGETQVVLAADAFFGSA